MSKPIPSIQKYMTSAPHSIGAEQTVAHAQKQMKQHGVRHLPVLHGGKLVGLLSERDVALIETLRDVDPEKVTVEDAMSQQVYAVEPTAALDEVASEMAEKKYGSAIVVQNQKVVGIFTTVDACRALAELLVTRLAK
jgi:acetoin utilization protein AcuB